MSAIRLDIKDKPREDLLQGRTILITGAGDGIGKQLSLCAAAHGANLVLLGRTQAKLEAVYDQIENTTPSKPIICPVDLETLADDQAKEIAEAIQAEFGVLDGLVHNAAILGQRTPIQSYSTATWQSVMQVNMNASFILSKALIPLMSESADARMLFTSSGVGRTGVAYWGAYSVSKFAIEGLAQLLADELTETTNIRVNAVNPGGTRTSMRAAAFPAENPAGVKSAEDLMSGYLYLLGPDSRAISGQSIDI
jgi:NAD(P)-dependent dehydrogenase (short-subunit alcohol dehydrogenase family)|tara:strand:+ start:127381 stop:128136 length:756 start_codon:yes stop_codon:yes gene_type:complete